VSYLQAVRLIHRDAWKMMLVPILVGFCYGGIYAVVFNLYLLRLGYGVEFVGLLTGTALMISALCGIPAGMVGRRWGLKRGVLAGYTVWVAASVLLPLAELLPVDFRSAWLLLIWSAAWVGAGLYGVNRAPYLIGLTSLHERAYVFSISSAASGVAAVAGSLLAGFLPAIFAGWLHLSLDAATSYQYTLCIPPLLYLLILPSLRSLPEVHILRSDPSGAMPRLPVMLIASVALFTTLLIASEAAASSFFNVYMDSALALPTSTIGLLIATGKLASVPAALVAPLLAARWGNFRTILGGACGLVLGAGLLATSSQWMAAGLGYILILVLVGILQPLQTIFHQEIVAPEWRSPMSGAVNVAEKVGRAAMVGAGGFLIVRVGYHSMFMSAALLTLLGALFLWAYFRRTNAVPANVALIS
jgi:MFS family permease